MEDDISDRAVIGYLHRRGFKQAEQAFRQEARITARTAVDLVDETSITNYVLFYNEDEANNPLAYEQSYVQLRKWIDDSIDIYKLELSRILFPIFVHAYLDLISKNLKENALDFFQKFKQDHIEGHGDQLSGIQSILAPELMQDTLVQSFRKNKYGVKMCKYSFELLLCFLQDNKFMLVLRLMNQYINIESLLI